MSLWCSPFFLWCCNSAWEEETIDKNNNFKSRLCFYYFACEVVNTQDWYVTQVLIYSIYRWETVMVMFDLKIYYYFWDFHIVCFPLLSHSELNSLFIYQPESLKTFSLQGWWKKRKLCFLQLELPVVFAHENWSLMFIRKSWVVGNKVWSSHI